MKWIYQGKLFTEPTTDMVGFVYLITEIKTGKKYIGKKLFWKYVKRKPRGQKRAKKVQRPSDWEKYFGSSAALNEDVNNLGEKRFTRQILRICYSKGELSYYEAKEQFDRDVLLSEDYYNEFIGCKIHAKHIKV